MLFGCGNGPARSPEGEAERINGQRPPDQRHGDGADENAGSVSVIGHVGDIGADQQEHHGIGQESREFPKGRHSFATPRADEESSARRRRAQVAHDQARGHGGQHAGNMKALRHEKRGEGGDGGQGDLDQMLRGASGEQDRRAAQACADADPARDHAHQRDRHVHRRGGVIAGGGPGQGQCKQHGGGAVIEQALAFDQQAQPPVDLVILEHGDDGDRIGRRNQRAEHKGRRRRPVEQKDHARRDDRHGDHRSKR